MRRDTDRRIDVRLPDRRGTRPIQLPREDEDDEYGEAGYTPLFEGLYGLIPGSDTAPLPMPRPHQRVPLPS